MTRTPILGQIAAILEAAPVAHEWLPESYTYCNLARQVYGVDEPTPAQLSAVRRAVAKLVAGGRAERRRGDRRFDPERTHVRRRRNGEFVYANPAGTEVRRPLTEAERQTRDKLRAAERARLAAGGSPWPALDTTVEEIWTPLTPELFIEGSAWVYARTMPQDPHFYTLKDPESKAPAMSPEAFEWFVAYVRERGTKRKFGGRSYIYLEVGEWRYWSMGAPVPKTTLINRARIDDPAQNTHIGGSGQLPADSSVSHAREAGQLGLDDDQENR